MNRSDWEADRQASLRQVGGLRRPRGLILGSDVAGRVVEVGSAVESFRVGDEVFGDVMYHGGSAFAEYVCVPETAPIIHKPPTVSFAEASTLPQAAVIALQGTPGALSRGIGSWSMVLAGERAPSRCRWRRPPGRRSLVSTTAGNRS